MNWTQIAENYWVSPQLDEAQIAQAAEFGINTIVCNRPDGEEPGQLSAETIQKACASNGLEFVFLPMQGPNFTPQYIATVQALNAEKKKVLAYCRSGNRSSILYNAAIQ